LANTIIGVVGGILIVFGLIFLLLEFKLKLPILYGFGDNSIRTNSLPIILVGIAMVYFRNGIDQINSLVVYGIFMTIELIVVVAYFILRNNLT